MVDLSNKIVKTESDEESEALLRIAVTQGYHPPKGLRAMIDCRIFKFIGFPYKTVSTLGRVPDSEPVPFLYSELFGDENEQLNKILDLSLSFCRTYGYGQLRVYADESENEYSGSIYIKSENCGRTKAEKSIPKRKKVTLAEIEKYFGYPVEIVS